MCIKNEIPWRNCENCLSETCHYRGTSRADRISYLQEVENSDPWTYESNMLTLDNMPCFVWYAYKI